MRQVELYEYIKDTSESLMYPKFKKVLSGEAGIFHQWGCGYEEFESGPGNFTTAIVEMPNGEVKSIPVEMIKFKEPLK